MPAHRVISKGQSDILLNYMEQNPWLASPSRGNSLMKKKGWASVAFTLNSATNGCKKSPEGWRNYWNELKYVIRRKVVDKHVNGRLTEREERVLAIAGKLAPIEEYIPKKIIASDGNSKSTEDPEEAAKKAELEQAKKRKDFECRQKALMSASPEMKYLIEMNERSLAAEEQTTEVLMDILKTVQSIRTLLEDKLMKPSQGQSDNDNNENDDEIGDEIGEMNVDSGVEPKVEVVEENVEICDDSDNDNIVFQ